MIVVDQAELIVSHDGKDFSKCGDSIVPCLTAGYALRYRSQSNDIIKIDNQHSDEGRPFIINETYAFKNNLTIIGINGKPIMSAYNPRFLFARTDSSPTSIITLTVVNIRFMEVGIAYIADPLDYIYITIWKCVCFATKFMFSYSIPVIEYFAYSGNSSIIINMKGTNVSGASTGISLAGLHVLLELAESHFENTSDFCFSALRLTNLLSLNVQISSTTFDNVNSINLKWDIGKTKSSANVMINTSILNGLPKNCFQLRGIYGNSGTFRITNTSLTSGMLLENSKMVFRSCTFGSFNELSPCSVGTVFNHVNATFRYCNFINNVACSYRDEISGQTLVIQNGNSLFSNCNFTNNKARDIGGGIFLHRGSSTFERCYFINNSATIGGAVGVAQGLSSGPIIFDNCHFENNSAFKVFNSEFGNGKGGAVAVFVLESEPTQSTTYVLNSYFKGNNAVFYGGAIMHFTGSLIVKNTSFFTFIDGHESIYAGGDVIYSFSNSFVTLENVLAVDLDNKSVQNSLITSTNLECTNVRIDCYQGKKGAVNGAFDKGVFNMVIISCSSCPSNTYSLSNGNVTFFDTDTTGYQVGLMDCFDCPVGGICDRGRLRAANNFWGYTESKMEVQFLACPFGYCCTGELCKTYNSCELGREGTLCGSCSKGLTENVITPDCLEPNNCHHSWFWLVMCIVGICYFIIFLFPTELGLLLKAILVPSGMTSFLREKSVSAHETPLLVPQDHNQEMMVQEAKATTEPVKEGKTSVFFSGLMKIFLFFYQSNILYKVHITTEKSISSFQLIEELLSTAFNLKVEGLFYQDLSWCPFTNLNPVSKTFFKFSFIVYLISLVMFTYIASRIWRLCKRALNQPSAIILRLLFCGLRLILISYATITSISFALLSCVDIHAGHSVLFIDGSIQCYQWWQYIIFLLVVCWVAPFPVAIYISSWLLEKKKLSIKMFVLFLLVPLAAILYWLYNVSFCCKGSVIELEDVSLTEQTQLDDGLTVEEKVSGELLSIMEGPFRQSDPACIENKSKLRWESMLVARRLVLISIKTFITNTVTRLHVMLLLTVVFLIHHVKMQPYSSTILNYVETGSLLMLTIICGLNILPAYNYMFPKSVSPFSLKLVRGFLKIETALALVFPVIVGSCFLFLLCIRICQLTLWLCKIPFRIYRVWMKRKSS